MITLGKEKIWAIVFAVLIGFSIMGGVLDDQTLKMIGNIPIIFGGPVWAAIRWFEIQEKYKNLK